MKAFHITLFAVLIALFSACSKSDSGGSSPSVRGQGGSMARFSIEGDILYTVDDQTLKLFDVATASKPHYMPAKDQKLNFGIETIFTMDSLLFIGSETGMHIYDISRPEFPQKRSFVSHIRSCDPVVACGNYAFVTLNAAQLRCGRGLNELHVYDISNLEEPVLEKTLDMNAPAGLGVDGNKLFVCDRGLKIYDISNPVNPIWVDDLARIPEADNIEAYDVIPLNGVLILTGANGLYQFDYTGEKIKFLSKIEIDHE